MVDHHKTADSPGPGGAPGAELPLAAPRLAVADRLRAATMTAHVEAERAAMEHLFRPSLLSRQRYAVYLGGLREIYQALEVQIDRLRGHPVLRELYFPALHRADAIVQDLASLGGNGQLPPPSAPVIAYRDRMQWAADQNPALLIAHIYTRYLGDLSGGQVIQSLLRRALQLDGDAGVRCLLFPQIPDLRAFKAMFRQRLNSVPISAELLEAVVAEALASFALTKSLFEALAAP